MATWTERTLNDDVIASVSFGKVTTGVMAVGQTLTLGDPAGTHMELSQAPALRVYRPSPDGDLRESVVLGGVDRDVVQIVDTTSGATLAGLFDDGAVTGLTGTFDELATRGQQLGNMHDPDDLLWPMPRGIVAAYQQTTHGATFNRGVMGVCEVAGQMQGGRRYRIRWAGHVATPQAGLVRMGARVTLNGVAPTTLTPFLTFETQRFHVAGTQEKIEYECLYSPSADPDAWYPARVLMTMWRGDSGSVAVEAYPWATAQGPATFTIEDVGPDRGAADGQMSTGGGTPPTGAPVPPPVDPKQQVTRTFPASWVRSWDADGDIRTDTPDAMQGYHSSARGLQRSQIGFPATSAIGRTIVRIRLRLCFYHWQGSSGTAVIGVHGNTSLPASFTYSGQHMSPNWSRGEYRWVTLPSTWYPAFSTGVNRGITLGGGASTAGQYYGRAYGYAATQNPILEVTTLE